MKTLQTEILVLGGGATGAGCARDAAMRGFKTILVEKRDLSSGTTGRYHGLLHSGGRYVVRDPHAARECIEENRILRRIMPHCIEDTGGFFVLTPEDDENYAVRFLQGCRTAGVPVEEISTAQMLKKEPLLNPQIRACYRVPDGSADSFLASESNAESARQHGASILNYHEVTSLTRLNDRITGAIVFDRVHDESITIEADLVINALGAWCGQIAQTAGVPITIIPGKGVMLAANHRIVNTVINRCKMPSDGDILVPAHTVAIIGTTDTPIDDPDRMAIEPWEVELMLSEGEKLIPGFRSMRFLRAWAGVRPLYKEVLEHSNANREVSRAFALLDHATRDGVEGLVTITSGKWTTYRKMAETTLDLVCRKLDVIRPCRTAVELLPGADHVKHYLGLPLAKTEQNQAFGSLVCECEMVSLEEVKESIARSDAHTFDDIRRDSRIGMGPCQGGFCTLRTAGLLHDLRATRVEATNASLRDFLQERWKGVLPVLWGQQLRQERLDELIYHSTLNAAALPGNPSTGLASQNYEKPARPAEPNTKESLKRTSKTTLLSTPGPDKDVVIIGAGLAGLAAAWQAAERGLKVKVVSKGMGALYWNAGTIDVLGQFRGQPVFQPGAAVDELILEQDKHPYTLAGIEALPHALAALQELAQEEGYPLRGGLETNWLLPTALGTFRTTCLAPDTMTAGSMNPEHLQDPTLIAGFANFGDFSPGLIAANLRAQGCPVEPVMIDLPALNARNFISSRLLASLFEEPAFRDEIVEAIRPRLNGAVRVGLPAVLGMDHAAEVLHQLEQHLGVHVFEIPSLPPSIPGIRLARMLIRAITKRGGQVFDGMMACGFSSGSGTVESIHTEAPLRQKPHRGGQFILATGGILGGGIQAGYEGVLQETVLNLPIQAPTDRQEWVEREFFSTNGHPVFSCGVAVNHQFRPIDPDGKIIYGNVFCAGSLLAHSDAIRERSLEGIALVSGYRIGQLV